MKIKSNLSVICAAIIFSNNAISQNIYNYEYKHVKLIEMGIDYSKKRGFVSKNRNNIDNIDTNESKIKMYFESGDLKKIEYRFGKENWQYHGTPPGNVYFDIFFEKIDGVDTPYKLQGIK